LIWFDLVGSGLIWLDFWSIPKGAGWQEIQTFPYLYFQLPTHAKESRQQSAFSYQFYLRPFAVHFFSLSGNIARRSRSYTRVYGVGVGNGRKAGNCNTLKQFETL
jgi:hypothetical protein